MERILWEEDSMRYKKVRVFFVNQHEKEEEWLNEMSAKGYAMVSIHGGIFYEFERCEPGEYIYRLELLEQSIISPLSMDYIRFLEDTGVEMVGSWVRWVYFRKKAKDGAFDLFSDLASKVNHFIRIRNFVIPFIFLEYSLALTNISSYISNFRYHDSMREILSNYNLIISILLTFFGTLFTLFFISLQRKINSMKKEHRIRE
jgi:hypothetical protein